MSVWSGETLRAKLPNLISPFNSHHIDCSSYVLSIGDEIYVSPSTVTERKKAVIEKLKSQQDKIIPPGQFAFLITAETVNVPRDAMAFISIRAKVKWRGLVNVSGFHVDPGYEGKLIFAVFNAGPSTIHLKCGDPCFLIWYISLDRESSEVKPPGSGYSHIPTDLVTGISGDWKSLYNFERRMESIEKSQAIIYGALAFAVALLIALFVAWIKPDIDAWVARTQASPSTAATTSPNPRSSAPGGRDRVPRKI
jgi:dCTP deaminase